MQKHKARAVKMKYCGFLITIALALTIFNGQVTEAIAARPPFREYAAMARYLVHKSNWTAMSSISIADDIKGYPVVSVVSVADSKWGERSTGNINFFMSNLSFTWKNIHADNKVTVLFSEDQDLACTAANVDPMEPTCARAIISGKLAELQPNTTEYTEADTAFTQRHPASLKWRKQHGFFFCKLAIEKITILAAHGGARVVKVDDYFAANFDA